MEFLVRFAQVHESFRRPELEALATLHEIALDFVEYQESSPFCIVRLPNAIAASTLVSRAILVQSIHELWGQAIDLEGLHADVKERTTKWWPLYMTISFKFSFDTFQYSHSPNEQRNMVESFHYMGFEGPIRMSKPDEHFTIFEHYEWNTSNLKKAYLGRFIGTGARDLVNIYSLKQRKYIATTSMDAELALIGANLALAAPGKLFYDPFVGTGGLPIACSHFGAFSMGSDLDGRCLRGKRNVNIISSFAQYGLSLRYVDGFVSDLTHSPLRSTQGGWLDGIVCDPPYGVREGLKVLGHKDESKKRVHYIDGKPAYLSDHYIAPKQAYSFEAMLIDILNFAAAMLKEDGRVSMWMPTANDEEQVLEIPSHGALELVSNCIQPFNKWSRRLLTYRRKAAAEITEQPAMVSVLPTTGKTADDLNAFRKKYFQGFKSGSEIAASTLSTSKQSP